MARNDTAIGLVEYAHEGRWAGVSRGIGKAGQYALMVVLVLLMSLRVELEKRRTRLDELYLALED